MSSLVVALSIAVTFTEMLPSSGIDFVNVTGDAAKQYIVSSLGGGAALFDFDGDGDLDLYLVNGMGLEGTTRVPADGNRLYRNDGGWRFTDVTALAGVGDDGWGVGCAAADYDNDGLVDLYVTNIGPNVLYRNRGDGTFVADDQAAGDHFSASAAFFDADRDGDLDLYVADYVDPDLSKIPAPGTDPTCVWLGMPVMCGPRGLDGQEDVFYRNDDGQFVDATDASGFRDPSGAFGLGVAPVDYDRDGDVDVYVANDTFPNFLYENDGAGRFTNIGLLSGAAYNASGDTEAGMGVDFADANGDGHFDGFVTNFSHETNTFYAGSESGLFLDVTDELGLGSASLGALGWGTAFVDVDHDGDVDLFVANGHVYPNVAEADDSTTYRQKNHVFVNDGAGSFSELVVLDGEAPSRGAAFGDVDGDGDVDVVVTTIDGPPSLLRNDNDEGHWLGVELVGRTSNRQGYGAIVEIGTQVKHAQSARSIFTASDHRVHFGLGDAERVAVRVSWPGGGVTVLEDVAVDRYITLVEGEKRGQVQFFLHDVAAHAEKTVPVPVSPAAKKD